MDSSEKDIAAADYARARVEEIKRKVANTHIQGKQNNTTSAMKMRSDSMSRNASRQPFKWKDTNEYECRIKNIDDINLRIRGMLGNKISLGNAGGCSLKETKTTVESNKSNYGLSPKKKTMSSMEGVDLPLGRASYKKSTPLNQNEKKNSLVDISMDKYTVSIEYHQPIKNPAPLRELPTVHQTQIYNDIVRKEASPIKTMVSPKSELSKYDGAFTKNTGSKQKEKEQNHSTGNKEITKLAETLSQQIIHDQKFRQAKWVFSEWDNAEKWELLCHKYQATYPGSGMEEVRSVFQICSEEHNPFFETPSLIDQNCITELLQNYKEALDYWQMKVDECVQISKLEKQFFNVKDLDLNRKGFISVEDLVCFVNLYTGNFFRNRDVFSLYKRFTKSEKLNYQSFLDKVTR